MLPAHHRLRLPGDFSHTLRSGVRVGRRNVVLYTAVVSETAPSKCGFIVSKAVGNAVARNLVKRRLREACVGLLAEHPMGVDIVLRALPASAGATWEDLVKDVSIAFTSALPRARKKAAASAQPMTHDGGDAA